MKQVHTCLPILFLQIYQILHTKPVNLSKQKTQTTKQNKDPQNQTIKYFRSLGF